MRLYAIANFISSAHRFCCCCHGEVCCEGTEETGGRSFCSKCCPPNEASDDCPADLPLCAWSQLSSILAGVCGECTPLFTDDPNELCEDPDKPLCCQYNGICQQCCLDEDCPEGQTCQDTECRSSACFAGTNLVQVAGRGNILMSDLAVGDSVWNGERYDLVYGFFHPNTGHPNQYLQIHTNTDQQPLEMTTEHLLYVGAKAVPAGKVQVGDELSNGGTVVKIDSVVRLGGYAPLTTSGKIMVNDILASNYIAFQHQDGSNLQVGGHRLPMLSYHDVGHAALSLHRLYCTAMNGCHGSLPLLESLDSIRFLVESSWTAWFMVPLGLMAVVAIVVAATVGQVVAKSRVGINMDIAVSKCSVILFQFFKAILPSRWLWKSLAPVKAEFVKLVGAILREFFSSIRPSLVVDPFSKMFV